MKNHLEAYEFITSLVTSILLLALTYMQYKKDRSYWWIILIASVFMIANAYVKYKNTKNKNNPKF